jgi:hypothetical protein
VRTLRLLLWLRLKLFVRATSRAGMIGSVLLNLLLLAAFSPVWLGGAIGAWAGVREYGAPVIPIAFGLAQFSWIGLGILSGALGRTFDLGKLLRYPVRPRTVFAINVFASLVNPVPLMAIPTLAGVALGAYQHAGAAAAAGAAVGGLMVLLITATMLQVLLALLDEVLRHERVRFLATAFMTLFFVAIQFLVRMSMREVLEKLAPRLLHHEITIPQALELGSLVFSVVPTVGAPAAIARGALAGSPAPVALGLAACLALLAAGILPGAALMRHSVRGGSSVGGGAAPARDRGATGSFAAGTGPLPRGVGLLLAREVRMTLRHPQRLMSVVMAPLVGVVFLVNARGNTSVGAGLALSLLVSSIGTGTLLLFGYDGPGVRSFFLLPCAPRDVVLAKNLELLARFALQLALTFGVLALIAHRAWSVFDLCVFLMALGLVFTMLAAGSAVAIRHPAPARQRGLSGRTGNNWAYTGMSLGLFAAGGALFGVLWLARRVSPQAWRDPVGLVLGVAALGAGAAIWWRSLDLNARLLVESRERIVTAIARVSEDAQ